MPIELAADQFDDLVAEALDSIPAELSRVIENCVILVEEWPPPDDPDLLGLYEGVPLTERGQYYGGTLPDRILRPNNKLAALVRHLCCNFVARRLWGAL